MLSTLLVANCDVQSEPTITLFMGEGGGGDRNSSIITGGDI